MSRWSDDFDSHAIHETLRQSQEWLGEEFEGSEFGNEEEKLRLKKILEAVENIISGIDPEFSPKTVLDGLNSQLRQPNFFQQLQIYSSSGNGAHLRNANDHMTITIPKIYELAAMSRPVEARDVIRSAEDAFGKFVAAMDERAMMMSYQIETSNSELEGVKLTADALMKSFKELETSADDARAKWQAEYTESKTSWAEGYSAAQIERQESYEALLSEWKEKVQLQVTEIATTHETELSRRTGEFAVYAETTTADMAAKHQSVLELHNLVGRDSVAGGYQQSAGEEHDAANHWRRVSMGALIASVLWLAVKYFAGFDYTVGAGINWPEIITASSLTAILLATGGYASSQSKMHRDNEKRMRSFALETTALDPFMASLSEAQQREIKTELIRRMFGQQYVVRNEKTSSFDETTINTISGKVIDGLKSIIPKVGPE